VFAILVVLVPRKIIVFYLKLLIFAAGKEKAGSPSTL